jgi:dipeptidase
MVIMRVLLFTGLALCLLAAAPPLNACTNLIVTKGASADGSVMLTYTCDGEFHPRLERLPAGDYAPGDSIDIKDWHGNVRGRIPQVEHTYAVVNLINEHQLVICETTFEGREELVNPDGLLGYWDLMELALQRARTAREAIDVMVGLVEAHGYRSSGESISIADTEEAWILEIIGPGEGGQGAEWVAVRVPDGRITAHANKARISSFPLDDPDNCVYSPNVITFAVERGYYDPDSGEPFSYCDAYDPATPRNLKFCEARVWSLFRRAAPSQEFSSDRHRAVEDARPYPWSIVAEKKLTVADVFDLMRDHYDGTPYDMTQGVDAGPYGCPNRWRPLDWQVDSVEYSWERPISTMQTGFSFVSQSRGWLPDPIGGVLWYGVDDTYATCYTPLYCGIETVPESFAVGTLQEFSWESAWWVFNFVSNFANLKYSYMIEDIQAVQSEIEGEYLTLQPMVEQTAVELMESDPKAAVTYLTHYSVSNAEAMVANWRKLGEFLVCKYNDGYVKNDEGRPTDKGYPDSWLSTVVKNRPHQFLMPQKDVNISEHKLVD